MNRFLYLFMVFVLNVSLLEASSQMKFRVQCASSNQNLSSELLKKMPELKMYMLPTGIKLFFWEGYYDDLNVAESKLKKVKEIGFRNACIRVFNGDVLLSKIEGDKYIASLKPKPNVLTDNSEGVKSTNEKKIIEDTEIVQKKLKTDSIIRQESKPTNVQPELLENHIVVKDNMPHEPTKSGGEAAYVNSTLVPYPPVFRIYLTNVSADSLVPKIVSQLKNETIYMYKQNGQKYYLVGTYENHQAAFSELQKYKAISNSASVVAEFRDRVISLDLAVELYDRYHNLPRRY